MNRLEELEFKAAIARLVDNAAPNHQAAGDLLCDLASAYYEVADGELKADEEDEDIDDADDSSEEEELEDADDDAAPDDQRLHSKR